LTCGDTADLFESMKILARLWHTTKYDQFQILVQEIVKLPFSKRAKNMDLFKSTFLQSTDGVIFVWEDNAILQERLDTKYQTQRDRLGDVLNQ
jgi:hypothetical protein